MLARMKWPILVTIAVLSWCASLQAGTSGKIAGIVTVADTGEPLEGATVTVEGFNIVTETDSDGEFYIINVPVGEYTLAVTMIGYEKINLTDIRVLVDLTTPVECEMRVAPIEIDRAVTVVAKRPIIQRDRTSTGAIVTRDEIAYLANANTVQAIVAQMNGTVVDASGELHVRGGRAGTVTYYYDGFSIQDPFGSDQGMHISPDALEELSLTSGGLAPEYGEALSGVVNAVTREGSRELHGRLTVHDGASQPYDVTTGKFGGLKRTGNQAIMFDVSGPLNSIGDRTSTFFSSIEYNRDGGYLPHNKGKFFAGSGKLVIFPTEQTKITTDASYYFQDKQRYDHVDVNGISYDFNLDGLGKFEKEAYLFGVKGQYNKSANTVFSASVNRFRTKTKVAPEDLFDLHYTQWPGYSVDSTGEYNGTIDDSNYVRSTDYNSLGFTDGNDFRPVYHNRFAAYNGAQISLLSQIDKYNQVKIGGEARRYELYFDERQFLNDKPYGETYSAFPWVGAAYIQDKMEFRDLVVNMGVRLDYFYSDMEYWNNPIDKDYRKKATPKTQWSPRLGISHPISANSVLHFNYGYLFQPPDVELMYTNLQGDLESGYPLFGNPDLAAEKTIYYELGLTQLLSDKIRLNLTTYYRDITNMIGAREVVDSKSNVFTVFANGDYGSTKGIDVALESINDGVFGWSLNYTYMVANGNASDPYDWYYTYYTVEDDDRPPIPTREYPLSFDERHSLTAIADFRIGPGEKVEAFGMTLPDAWGINILGTYNSGMPYTRVDKQGKPTGSLNGERMPYNLRFDLRFNKDFYFTGHGSKFLTFFVEVENLFDRRNVINVYNSTGKADDAGTPYLNTAAPNYAQAVEWNRLLQLDPQNYSAPREMRVGLTFNF